ncbi:hypothetical protein GCM10010387_22740 [Streptomyces inusitatus]|uniref:Uncharacterized protein n=1 Tax=Streptomyces inusitatus TaxID=68221 RepID=A0A918Q2Q5_9ACTN|nr:hypothetical protein [Streptomyces inusitatus]GGZ28713.1 hypothetical protein GCM10010387_22740 [Streptomyces inusitatus]
MVALAGPGWALDTTAAALTASALLATLRLGNSPRPSGGASVVADLREGWQEFSSRTWPWVTALQFALVIGALQAAYEALRPVVARRT